MTNSHSEITYEILLTRLREAKLIPSKKGTAGIYVHKSRIGYHSSLVISPNQTTIYALIHHPSDAAQQYS